MTTDTAEVNFDGLVGPTHNYAGLSLGNRASMGNAGAVSNPRQAAKQGLRKMRLLHSLGVPQGVLPPQWRPDPQVLASLGFADSTGRVSSTGSVNSTDIPPALVPTLLSASSMWAANAATVSPSADTEDGRVHLTPANLSSTTHRSFEAAQTEEILRTIFADRSRFEVHQPLPAAAAFADEGAANHGRLCTGHGNRGVHLFVYGRDVDDPAVADGFPRRQTRLAGELIARSHGLNPTRVVHARQAAVAIDSGAFHNDVVSVINNDVVFAHELAFDDKTRLVDDLQAAGGRVRYVEVPEDDVPLGDAISSYLFNSQLVTLPDGSMTLIAPREVEETPTTAAYLQQAIVDGDNPISSANTLDLRESMRNGGGPACLRLRVVMTAAERAALSGRVIVDDALLDELEAWVDAHYRDALAPDDLSDPALAEESARALDELARLLELDRLYRFQR
jgi:succinylarginine dihydrolase